MTAKTIELKRLERIVAVVPDFCSGSGWSNSVVWVFIEDTIGGHRYECLQPGEWSTDMYTLFTVGAAMCEALRDAVPTKQEEK